MDLPILEKTSSKRHTVREYQNPCNFVYLKQIEIIIEVNILEIAFFYFTMVNLMPQLLNFNNIATYSIYAISIKALVFYGCYDFINKQRNSSRISFAQVNQICAKNTFLKQINRLRLHI